MFVSLANNGLAFGWFCHRNENTVGSNRLKLADYTSNFIRYIFHRIRSIFKHLHQVLAFDDLVEAVALAEELVYVAAVAFVVVVFKGLDFLAEAVDFLAFFVIRKMGESADDVAQALGGEHDVLRHGGEVFIDIQETACEDDVAAVVDAVHKVVHQLGQLVDVFALEWCQDGAEKGAVELIQNSVATRLTGLDLSFQALQTLEVGLEEHLPQQFGGLVDVLCLLLVKRVELLFLGDEILEETVETHGIT